uniref:DUF3828 domain-containing protein n=1 Tax=Desulfovibrio sp. U5L TaxID=596152 RepID=I2Q134_9BACT
MPCPRSPRLPSLLWLVLVLLIAAAPAHPAGNAGYHVAASEAEKALDKVLHLSGKDPNLLEFVLRTPSYKPKADKGYARFFTKRLLDDMAAQEKAAVQENCNGRYVAGELCGLDYNPLTCAQDEPAGAYRYKTESSAEEKAVVAYKWPEEKDKAATFEMVEEGGMWKVDRVTCRP